MAKVSWSMGELVARVATPVNEGRWLELAQSQTVRQMRALVTEAMTAIPEAAASGTATPEAAARAASIEEQPPTAGVEGIAHSEDDSFADLQSGGSDESCTLTCTVDRGDAWLFEATQCLLEQLGVTRLRAGCPLE